MSFGSNHLDGRNYHGQAKVLTHIAYEKRVRKIGGITRCEIAFDCKVFCTRNNVSVVHITVAIL